MLAHALRRRESMHVNVRVIKCVIFAQQLGPVGVRRVIGPGRFRVPENAMNEDNHHVGIAAADVVRTHGRNRNLGSGSVSWSTRPSRAAREMRGERESTSPRTQQRRAARSDPFRGYT